MLSTLPIDFCLFIGVCGVNGVSADNILSINPLLIANGLGVNLSPIFFINISVLSYNFIYVLYCVSKYSLAGISLFPLIRLFEFLLIINKNSLVLLTQSPSFFEPLKITLQSLL